MKKTAEYENELDYEASEAEPDEEKIPYRKWGKIAFFAAASFLFAQLDFFYGFSPFTVAFVGAIPFEFCFSAFVGGSLGCFTCLSMGEAARVSAALFILCLFRLIIEKKLRREISEYINGTLCFIVCVSAGVAYNFFSSGEWGSFFGAFFEGIVSFVFSVIFIKSRKTHIGTVASENISVRDKIFLGSSFCAFLMCAASFDVEGLSPVRMLAFLLILLVSVHKGVAGSLVVGVCAALSLSINEDYRFLFSSLVPASLFAGVFAPLGQTAAAIAFAVISAGLSAFSGDYGIICVIETVISSAVFIIIPQKYVAAFESFVVKKGFSAEKSSGSEVAESLLAASDNIYGVAELVSSVSEQLDGVINPEVNRLFTFLQQRVCDGCQKKFLCWNRNFDSTASDVLTIAGIEKNKKIQLQKNCDRYENLSLSVDEGYREYAESLQSKVKLSEMRKVLTDQFTGMGDFLRTTALSVSQSRIPDKGKSAVLKTALSDSGIYTDALSVYTDTASKMTVEITSFDPEIHEHHKKIKAILEFITKRKFEKADITVTEIRTVIVFEEKSLFSVRVGVAQKALRQGDVCGDSVAIIRKQGGRASVILSDGMGTGARAKVDSTMTCSVMEKLLRSDFTFDSALKIVNSSLIMKSTDESIATIDGVTVNLFTGTVNFFKAGGSLTFIRHGNEIITLEGVSLPVGIIRNVEFWKSEKELSAGDIVLLLSDGAVGEDCGWISDELLSWNTADMDDLAGHIARLASLRMTDNTKDDITVVAVKLVYNKE